MRITNFILICTITMVCACSKPSGGGGGTPDPCAGLTISVIATTTNPTTGSNGVINASASGGSLPFTFSLNGSAFQSSGNFSGLAAGTYSVTAKNSAGCTGSATFTLTAVNVCTGVNITLNATTVNPTSAVATNGSISATASGSSGFTFNLNGGAFQGSGNFPNLATGSYTIIAKDANGCTGTGVFNLTAPNLCTGVTINLSTTVTGNRPCENANGSIMASATGGLSPYSFNINGGVFQVSNNFIALGAATYIISAKDANGCTGTSSVVLTNLSAGPLFSAVKTVLQQNCTSCHNNAVSQGGMNWEVDCNIVSFQERIRVRAVVGSPSAMPPSGLMPASERTKITNWINAGGRFTD